MHNGRIQFANRSGQSLAGLIDVPEGGTRAWALFAHCFTCSKNLKAATHIVKALNDAGIAVMRFDFTGLGQSEGEFGATSFSSNVTDLVDAAGWLESEYAAPSILLGHSLGGTAVLRARFRRPSPSRRSARPRSRRTSSTCSVIPSTNSSVQAAPRSILAAGRSACSEPSSKTSRSTISWARSASYAVLSS